MQNHWWWDGPGPESGGDGDADHPCGFERYSVAMNIPIRTKGQLLSFRYGDKDIAFERIKRSQATGKVLIKVLLDCHIVVSALEDADNDVELGSVKKRGCWIYQQLRELWNP